MKFVFLAILLVLAWYFIFASNSPKKEQPPTPAQKEQARKTLEGERRFCQNLAKKFSVQKLIEGGVFYRVKGGDHPRVWVHSPWYGLTMDEKKLFDSSVLCWLSDGQKMKKLNVYVRYLDARNEREVAVSGKIPFKMK